MFEMWGISSASDALSMLLDGLLLLVMVALWWLWWQQARQRKQVEIKLGEAAGQLQEATKMLDEALQQIAHLQAYESKAEEELEDEVTDDVKVAFSAQSLAMSKAHVKRQKTQTPVAESRVKESEAGLSKSSQSAQILRMQREGVSSENIAIKMNIPLAQVKLMLMLQKAQ
ncbi:MAG: hypothetical protein COB41_00900 [Proteobacteria bacterium]|nr:MAG: hypothetical protein COB41_00900 [Pseudomonadota bacterium]